MNFSKMTTVLAAAVAAAGTVGTATAFADETMPTPTSEIGSPAKLENGGVVQMWTISDLKPSMDIIPYQSHGTLWEATATNEAVEGSVTPIVSNLNARTADGQQYRVLFQVATPQGVNPATLAQGQKTTGKVYFDVTGEKPTSVVYTTGDRDVAAWTQAAAPVQVPAAAQPAPARSQPAPVPAPAAAPTTPVPEVAPVPAPAPVASPVPAPVGAGDRANDLPTGSQGTPVPAGSQGTPLPESTPPVPATAGAPVPGGSQGTPLPAGTEGAPVPANAPAAPVPGGTQGTPLPEGIAPAPGGQGTPVPGGAQPPLTAGIIPTLVPAENHTP